MATKKVKKIITSGRIYVNATFNNTMVNITDRKGETLCWASGGSCGFKGARKSTPFAASTAMEKTLSKASEFGLKEVEVYIKGPGSGREAVLRSLRTSGLSISLIADKTPIPHNGCRPKKKRRV